MKTRGKKRKRASLSYTKGNLNKIVDAICHPFFEKNESFRLVDVFLHGLVEQNPRVTIRKFVEYNLPTLTRQLEKAIKKL